MIIDFLPMFKELRSVFILLSVVLLGYCSKPPKGHEIRVRIRGLQDSVVVFGYHLGNERLVRDSLPVSLDGEIVIQGDSALPKGMYFLHTPSIYLELIVDEQHFSMETTVSGKYDSLLIEGSNENIIFRQYQALTGPLTRRRMEIKAELEQESADTLALAEQTLKVIEDIKVVRDSLMESNPESFFAKMMQLQVTGIPFRDGQTISLDSMSILRTQYMDKLKDPADMMRTPVIYGFVMHYFDYYVQSIPDSIKLEIDRWLQVTSDDEEVFRYWLEAFQKKYKKSRFMGKDDLMVMVFEDYYLSGKTPWMDSESLKKLRREVESMKPTMIGSQSPPLHLIDTGNNPVHVQELPQEYLVLYFYDPNCEHCKVKTPILHSLYGEFKKLGAEVVAICTDTDEKVWKQYVRDTGLTWVNLADPDAKSNFWKTYNIRGTPKVFVLDKDRKILAKNIPVKKALPYLKTRPTL